MTISAEIKALSPMQKTCRGFSCLVASIASAMSFVVRSENYVGMSDLPASSTSLLWTALAICFFLFFNYLFVRKQMRVRVSTIIFGLLFGVLNTFASTLFAFDSWAMLASEKTLLLTLARSIGQALPMIACLTWVIDVLANGLLKSRTPLDQWTPKRLSGLHGFYEKHPILSVSLFLILCWSPYLIAFYPGTVCWDLSEMIAQFFGQRAVDTWHPVFLTWVFGALVWLGRIMGSDNLGALLFTLLQTIALAYALSSVLVFLKKTEMNRMVRLVALLFFAVVPFWGGYAQFISKDTLYTATLLLFTLEMFTVLLGAKIANTMPKRSLIKLFCWALLTCLIRSNGIYVILPTALLMVLFAAKGRGRFMLGASLGAAVVVTLLFSNMLLPALGVRDESASGLYSVCFQQSARVLRDHGDEVLPEEYAEIDVVLDAANLPKLYEPWISDPVKYTFKQYGLGAELEKEALSRYRSTWLSMMSKYPLSYLESFFAGNISYYTFMPKIEGETYNNQAGNRMVFETYLMSGDPRFIHTEQISAFEGMRSLLAIFARGWRHIPILGVLFSCAFYTWLLVGAGLSVWMQHRWRVLIAFVPAFLSLAVCMLSPVNDYFRYFLPIVAMTLPLLAISCRADLSEES